MVNTGVPGRRQQYLLVLLCGPDASRAKAPSGARPMLPAGGQRPRGCPPALLFTGRRAVLPVPTSPSVCRQHFLTSSSLEERSQRSVTAPLYPPAGEVPWRRSSSLRPKCRRGGRGGCQAVSASATSQRVSSRRPWPSLGSWPSGARQYFSWLYNITPKRLKNIPQTVVTQSE